jgi:hypothetical protein
MSLERERPYVGVPIPELLQISRARGQELEWCHYCGLLATTKDHVVPKARGGSNHAINLVPCCYDCNQRKADDWPDSWHGEFSDSVDGCPVCVAAIEFFRTHLWASPPAVTDTPAVSDFFARLREENADRVNRA